MKKYVKPVLEELNLLTNDIIMASVTGEPATTTRSDNDDVILD